MTMSPWLEEGMKDIEGERLLLGAVVERADVGRRAAVLRVRAPGETWLVLLGCGGDKRVGVLPIAARERVHEVFRAMLREPGTRRILEGARIEAIDGRGVRLVSQGRILRLAVGSSVVRIEGGVSEEQEGAARSTEEGAWVARGEELLGCVGRMLLQDAKNALAATLGKEKRKLERRVEAIHGDLAKAADAEALADRARWFVAEAARAPRGARELTVNDWSTGEGRAVTLALDPKASAKSQIDAIFARARRMQNGMEIARTRMAAAHAAIALLQSKLLAVHGATSEHELEGVVASSSPPAPPPPRTRAPKGKEPRRRPYRLFRSGPGTPILAGRGAADNDALTFRIARPHDLWLHAQGIHGAHVVLPLDKGKESSSEALVDAAHLAAHFSGHRAEASVEVQYAPRGQVRKPRGSPPGFVVVDHARAMLVRMEPDRLARLLASEEVA